jgi:nitrite reductase/ring-hydroxylating ferredoxin subunit
MSSAEKEFDLGPADDVGELPAELTVDGAPYWLVRTPEGGFRLLMALCPHAGGDVRPTNGVLFCPLHWWTFDAATGACLNVPGEQLRFRDVETRNGRLIALAE